MSCANPNEANKRQLPQWMLLVRASSANPVCRPESEPKVKEDDDLKVHKTCARNLNSRVETGKHDAESFSCEDVSKRGISQVNEKCGGRRSKRKPDTEHKLKAKALKGTNDRAGEKESTLSEELTVEDLVSIAKELIKNNAKKDELSSSMTDKLLASSSTTSYSKGGRLHNQSVDHIHEGNLIRNLSKSASNTFDFIENRTSDNRGIHSSCGIGRTGDSAQDMLDILLGPLLRTSKAAERKADLLLSPTKTVDCDHGDKERQGEVEEDPMTKKKSSLKDKVEMLLT